jgi:hypothetical protein
MDTPDSTSPPRRGGKLLLGIVGGLIIVALIAAGECRTGTTTFLVC